MVLLPYRNILSHVAFFARCLYVRMVSMAVNLWERAKKRHCSVVSKLRWDRIETPKKETLAPLEL